MMFKGGGIAVEYREYSSEMLYKSCMLESLTFSATFSSVDILKIQLTYMISENSKGSHISEFLTCVWHDCNEQIHEDDVHDEKNEDHNEHRQIVCHLV